MSNLKFKVTIIRQEKGLGQILDVSFCNGIWQDISDASKIEVPFKFNDIIKVILNYAISSDLEICHKFKDDNLEIKIETKFLDFTRD